MKDYFAFFKFYYYLFKRSPRKYDMVSFQNNNYQVVLFTPFFFMIGWMILFIIFGSMGINWIGIPFLLSGLFMVLNLYIAQEVYTDGRQIQRELDEQRRRAEYEQMRRDAEQRAREERRRMEERMRREKEAFERWKRAKEQYRYHTGQQQRSQSSTTDRLRQCYALLGIEPTRDTNLIRKAYRSMAKKHHPDMGGSQQQFIALKNAYDLLMKAVEVTARKV